jgi:hypothetical protein
MRRRSSWPRPPSRRPTTPGSRPSTTSRSATSSPGRAAALLLLAWLAAGLPAAAQPPAPPPAEDKVQAYLARLGLTEYEVLYLEGQLDRGPAGRKEGAARKLAALYADLLLDTDGPAAAAAVQAKARDLLARFPAVRTPAVEVMLLQGEFARAEVQVGRWLLEPDDVKARDDAAEVMDRVVPALDAHARALEAAYKREQGEAEKLKDGPAQKARQAAADKTGQQFGRAAFFGGWGAYYQSLLRGDRPGGPGYARAKERFKKLVPLDKPEADTDPDEVGLGSAVRARAVLGLALAEAGTGDLAAATGWFDLLRKPQVSEQVRPAVDFWQLVALTKAGAADEAGKFARDRLAAFGDTPTAARRNFCTLLAHAGGRDPSGPLAPLAELGVQGLVQLRSPDLARKMAARYGVKVGPDTHAGRMLTALDLLDKAKKSKAKADYRTAAAAFEQAADGVRGDPALANSVRFQHGYCLAKAEDWPAAAGVLEKAAPALQAARSESAGDAAWLLIAAYDRMQAADAQVKAKLVAALKAFPAAFPDHPRARAAGNLLAAVGGADADLAKLDPNDPDAGERLAIAARRAYNRWRAVKDDPAKGPPAAAEVAAAAEKLLAVPDGKAPAAGRLEAAFLATDALLNGAKADPPRAARVLGAVEAQAAALPAADRAASDFRVLKLQYAQAAGDLPAARAAADWLTQNRKGTPLEEAALVGVAKAADARLAAAPAEKDRLADAVAAYRALADRLGPTADRVRGSRNAQVANSRLAALLYDAGRLPDCKQVLEERLLKAYPKEVKYLRLAGLVAFDTRDNDRSLECWRVLTALPSGTPGWYEAKYYHMATLARVDRAAARNAFEQFRVLHPELGPADLRDRFRALGRELQN